MRFVQRTAATLLLLLVAVPGYSRGSGDAATKPATTPDVGHAFAATPYAPPVVKASVKPYVVAPTLANVTNFARWSKVFRFTPEQKGLIAKNGFVVVPASEEQLFFVYENNDYLDMPSFVTTDSVLQVYHVFYDYTLRQVEQTKLIGELESLSDGLVAASEAQYAAATDPQVKEAARLNLAYAAVARKLADPAAPVPAAAADLVGAELRLVAAHAGRAVSPIFSYNSDIAVDYSQFVPRGHYTRTPELSRYFGAMMWYGLIPFPLENAKTGERTRLSTLQALLLSSALYAPQGEGKPALIEHWDHIYAPTAFYVGVADDLTPVEYHSLAAEIFGPGFGPETLADPAKVDRFLAEATKRFRGPGIAASIGDVAEGTVQRRQFRLMGQRFIVDSRIFQELTYPKVGTSDNRRLMPQGLDVMAALGSERAAEILRVDPNEKGYENYATQSTKMRQEMDRVDDATWGSNLYYAWLWTLRSLLAPAGPGYPSFMQTKAWADKSLSTALASWSELKHDTVLYGKQSGAECGGGDEPPAPKGYVEPNPELYARLAYLTRISREGLKSRGLIPEGESVDTAFGQFDDLLTFLQTASTKELRNEALTEEEYVQIRYYGAQLEHLTLSVIDENLSGWFELQSQTDKDMAIVSDVHTGGDRALEAGVGHADTIFVVAPVAGRLVLTRGAVFSYFEFPHPAADRLTDEAWQGMLKGRQSPARPSWARGFMSGAPVVGVKPKEVKVYNSGC